MNDKQVYSIRGATTVESNTESEIQSASVELINTIREKNNLQNKNIINIIISSTEDITASYPAKAVRESGFSDVPIFSCVEPDIDGGLPMCIRFLITAVNFEDKAIEQKHVYLRNASKLRPDLSDT